MYFTGGPVRIPGRVVGEISIANKLPRNPKNKRRVQHIEFSLPLKCSILGIWKYWKTTRNKLVLIYHTTYSQTSTTEIRTTLLLVVSY